jgi:hypothetical protein
MIAGTLVGCRTVQASFNRASSGLEAPVIVVCLALLCRAASLVSVGGAGEEAVRLQDISGFAYALPSFAFWHKDRECQKAW